MSTVAPPQVPTQTQTATPDTVLNTKTQRQAAIIGALAVILGPIVTGIVTYNLTKEDKPVPPPGPPQISNLSVEWIGQPGRQEGRYTLTGEVENLGPDDMVWGYNQPLTEYDSDGDGIGDSPGGIYPEHGPCVVDNSGSFTCDLGMAGRPEEEAGKPFSIWAAVVTDEHAHAAALLKAGYTGTRSFANEGAVPHVEGEDALVAERVTRPERD